MYRNSKIFTLPDPFLFSGIREIDHCLCAALFYPVNFVLKTLPRYIFFFMLAGSVSLQKRKCLGKCQPGGKLCSTERVLLSQHACHLTGSPEPTGSCTTLITWNAFDLSSKFYSFTSARAV